MATFDRLLATSGANVTTRHIVDEDLLRDARDHGITPELVRRIHVAIEAAFAADAAVVLCTCSTIGGVAEQAGQALGRPVQRVDRAMAAQAVASGKRIVVVAALESTLPATRDLLREEAARKGKHIDLVEHVCDGAWARFEQGDHGGYLADIAACVRVVAARGDVVVLAQASMSGAVALCPDVAIPVLSSPELGLAAVLAMLRVTG
jgi:hypothetical protein